MLVDSSLSEGAFRPEESYLQRLLLCKTRGHDLAKQAQHLLVSHRTLVALQDVAQYFRLTLGSVVVNGRGQVTFCDTDLLRNFRSIIDQRLYLFIDTIDALTNLGESRLIRFLVRPCHLKLARKP